MLFEDTYQTIIKYFREKDMTIIVRGCYKMKMIIARSFKIKIEPGTLESTLFKTTLEQQNLAATGGSLRAGNTTFLCGVNDDRVDEILSVINQTCGNRTVGSPNPHL